MSNSENGFGKRVNSIIFALIERLVTENAYICSKFGFKVGKIANSIWLILGKFRYHVVIVTGVLLVVFLSDNSLMKYIELGYQIDEKKEEIAKYTQQHEEASRALKELQRNPRAIEKVARERYFMKTDDEDIFVLSDDEKPVTDNSSDNETTE